MDDAEATVTQDIFAFDEDGIQAARQALSRDELLARVTALMQSCEGCETVGVVGVTPEVYGLAYAQVIALARSSWNLQ